MREEKMKFSESHEWIKLEGDVGDVGISDHAQHELGDIVYVELPKVGAHVEKGMEIAVLESTKAASDVYTPVSGQIIEVNEALNGTPGLINESPESLGWIYKIKLADKKEYDLLLDANGYKAMLHGRL